MFAPVMRHLPGKAKRRLMLLLGWVLVYVAAAQTAQAKTTPDGLGGLIKLPDLSKGQPRTLLESYGPARYEIFQDLGRTDVVQKVVYPLYAAFNEICYALTKLAVGLTWWLQTASTTSTGTDAIGAGIQSTAGSVAGWLLPTTMVWGAIVAYAQAKRGEGALGQIVGLGLIVLFVAGLSVQGKQIVQMVDASRVQVASLVNDAGVGAVQKQNEPFTFSKDPDLNSDTEYATERAAGDVVWRQFYVTPWCQSNFGSQAACKAYADKWLATPGHKDRKDYLHGPIADAEEADDAQTVEFIRGKAPATRMGVALMALVTALGAVIVIGGLAFFSLLPWLLALVLMFLAVFFLCIMVIPGWPREVGKDFLLTILGQTLLSALMGGLLSAMLLLVIQASKMSATGGWVASMLVTSAALGAAWSGRKILSQKLTGSSSGGMGLGGALLGGMMLKSGMSRAGRAMRSRGKSGGKTGGGSTSDGGSGNAGGTKAERAAQRAGQVTGAVRRPVTASRTAGRRAGEYFQARQQTARAAGSRVRGAAAKGYAEATGQGGRGRGRPSNQSGSGGGKQGKDHAPSRNGRGPNESGDTTGSTGHDSGGHATPAGRGNPAAGRRRETQAKQRRGERGATSKNLPPRSSRAARTKSSGTKNRSQRSGSRSPHTGGPSRPSKPMRRSTRNPGSGPQSGTTGTATKQRTQRPQKPPRPSTSKEDAARPTRTPKSERPKPAPRRRTNPNQPRKPREK